MGEKEKREEMGKGGKGEPAAAVAGEGENMAAWLVAKNTLKIMPFKLPPLGLCCVFPFVGVSLPSINRLDGFLLALACHSLF